MSTASWKICPGKLSERMTHDAIERLDGFEAISNPINVVYYIENTCNALRVVTYVDRDYESHLSFFTTSILPRIESQCAARLSISLFFAYFPTTVTI